jgi:hypothetical protein
MNHGGGGRGRKERGTSCTPSKDLKKFGHKNAIKHEKEDALDFLLTSCTPSKEFEYDCASITKISLGHLFPTEAFSKLSVKVFKKKKILKG